MEQELATAAAILVQAVSRRPPGDGAAEVEKIAVTFGARPDHRIGEHDGVAFTPCDLIAEMRPKQRLIGSAGE